MDKPAPIRPPQLKENQYPINSTTTRLPLRVQYHPLSWFKFTIYASMSANFEAQQSAGGAASGTGAELDELKHMLLETNPWLLAVTITVTLLHMLFEFLAFSSDVQHWRKKDKSLVGVSLRTILTNCFVQVREHLRAILPMRCEVNTFRASNTARHHALPARQFRGDLLHGPCRPRHVSAFILRPTH
jgi:hypothetical protein